MCMKLSFNCMMPSKVNPRKLIELRKLIRCKHANELLISTIETLEEQTRQLLEKYCYEISSLNKYLGVDIDDSDGDSVCNFDLNDSANESDVSDIENEFICDGIGDCNSTLHYFGIPYFKDAGLVGCPPNVDHMKKIANDELIWVEKEWEKTKNWSAQHKTNLEKEIERVSRANYVKKLLVQKSLLNNVIRSNTDPMKIEEFTSYLNVCNDKMRCVDAMTLTELVKIEGVEDYDWNKIAFVLGDEFSAIECSGMWNYYLHPKFKRGKWTNEEDVKLIDAAKRNHHEDWDKIARESGNRRSGYQCFTRFRMKLHKTTFDLGDWTPREDRLLLYMIQMFQLGNFVPWDKISQVIEGRSVKQLYMRWHLNLHPDIKKGKFSEKEDLLIAAGMKVFGLDFKRISSLLPGRTSSQVSSHYYGVLRELHKQLQWTDEDNYLLLEKVKIHGHDWKKISEYFVNSNRVQLRNRYLQLTKGNGRVKTKINVPTKTTADDIWRKTIEIIEQFSVDKIYDIGNSFDILNEDAIDSIREKLGLKVKRGRKMGQVKKLSSVDNEFVHFLCHMYLDSDKDKTSYSSVEIEKNCHTFCCYLNLLHAYCDFSQKTEKKTVNDLNSSLFPKMLAHLSKKGVKTLNHEFTLNSESGNTSLGLQNTAKAPRKSLLANSFTNLIFYDGSLCSVHGVELDVKPPTTATPRISFVPHKNVNYSGLVNIIHPPSITTLLCFRSLIIRKKVLTEEFQVNLDSSEKGQNFAELTFLESAGTFKSDYSVDAKKAAELWRARLFSLLYWPAIMSKVPVPLTLTDDSMLLEIPGIEFLPAKRPRLL